METYTLCMYNYIATELKKKKANNNAYMYVLYIVHASQV